MHSGNDNDNGNDGAGDICDDSYCQHLCEVMPGTSRQPQPEPQNSLPQLTPLMARIIKRHGWWCTEWVAPPNHPSHPTRPSSPLIHTLPSSSHNFCFLQVALAFAIVKWHPHPHPRRAAVCTKISRWAPLKLHPCIFYTPPPKPPTAPHQPHTHIPYIYSHGLFAVTPPRGFK